ncbi:hypothetical protein Mgra_00003195 [Meloidogyne graminicola]|uniref:Ig-like domain-containing protein n=1 Tax=Meloidogyne graminicola TaxID=189291 RepID=A0A8S9ZUS1_9BILA|nr:hypothetical protein Mgra_00003195 [Meloidogyne graminicola]
MYLHLLFIYNINYFFILFWKKNIKKIIYFLFLFFVKMTEELFNENLFLSKTAWSSSLQLGWSSWSEWSLCPPPNNKKNIKKCNNYYPLNIQYQLRRCLDKNCSEGPSSKYRLCSNLNNNKCLLNKICNSSTIKSNDGYPCYLNNNNNKKGICFKDICHSVGCDKIIGSLKTKDQCGICGGDGSSCYNKLFKWKDIGHYSNCKGKCGNKGISASVSFCINIFTNRFVPEKMCSKQKRPRPKIRICSSIILCKKEWKTTNWSDCSVNCGIGEQKRKVYCAEIDNNGQQQKQLNDQHCWHLKKPLEIRLCNINSCPEWAIGDWGICQKINCGRGIRSRQVECRSEGKRLPDWKCLLNGKKLKPQKNQPCWTGIPCNEKENNERLIEKQNQILKYSEEKQNEEKEEQFNNNINNIYYNLNDENKYLKEDEQKPKFYVSKWSECSTSCGPGIRSRQVECMANQIKLTDYECIGQSRPIQFRHCQLIPCSKLSTQKQLIGQQIITSSLETLTINNYKWKYGRWTICSESCLGGQQKLSLLCIELSTGRTFPHSKCEEESSGAGKKPEELIRQCNQQQCPSNWEVSEWSICSHSCGGGIRTRQVKCIQLISKKSSIENNTLLLPDIKCFGQKPENEEPCGMVDCAPEWKFGNWSECSTSCGLGEQKRSISCIQRNSFGKIEEKKLEECILIIGEMPINVQKCNNLVNCSINLKEENINNNNNNLTLKSFIYSEPFNNNLINEKSAKDQPLGNEEEEEEEMEGNNKFNQPRKLTLQIGGIANLYEGTSVKVKCPIKLINNNNNNKRKIIWTVNGYPIRQSSRLKISQNGALRIFNSRQHDAGIYACYYNNINNENKQIGNVTLKFKIDSKENKINNNNNKYTGSKLIQKIRNSLYNIGQYSLYEKIASANPNQIRVEFTFSEWGECEQFNCIEKEGIQTRQLFCSIFVDKEFANLNDLTICELFGISKPLIKQKCLNTKCAHWESGKWSECLNSKCIKQFTSLQKREVKCIYGNKTEANSIFCLKKNKPKLKRECQNVNCLANWKPSIWSKCSKKCGDGGVQMRILNCIWNNNNKPAGSNCNQIKRPITIKACKIKKKLPECFLNEEEKEKEINKEIEEEEKYKFPLRLCEDQSRFCDILRLFQTCDQPRIKEQCCFSCKKLIKELNN